MNLSKLLFSVSEITGASVNIETLHSVFVLKDSLKLAPNQYTHYGHYCRFVKLSGEVDSCLFNKRRSIVIAKYGKAFCGACPHGIWEIAQPVIHKEELLAVLYLGHLKTDKTLDEIQGKKYSGPDLPEISAQKKEELFKYGRFIANFIRLEVHDWFQSNRFATKHNEMNFYYNNCIKYIDTQYNSDISLDEFAKLMKRNPNYIGGLIKKASGKTFRQLLNERRIKAAIVYLSFHKSYNISQVAFICGFNDSNYFSSVFRKFQGMSPRQYRIAKNSSKK